MLANNRGILLDADSIDDKLYPVAYFGGKAGFSLDNTLFAKELATSHSISFYVKFFHLRTDGQRYRIFGFHGDTYSGDCSQFSENFFLQDGKVLLVSGGQTQTG